MHAQPLYDLVLTAYRLLKNDPIPATIQDEIKIHNQRANFINNQLDLILPTNHAFKIRRRKSDNTKKNSHPLTGLQIIVQGWLKISATFSRAISTPSAPKNPHLHKHSPRKLAGARLLFQEGG